MRLGIVVALALCFVGSNVRAAEAPPTEVRELADQFFASIKDGHTGDAFRSALVNMAAGIGDANLKAVSSKAEENLKLMGPILGWAPIRTTYVFPDLIDQTYVLRGSTIPIFFRFAMYNPGTTWRIIDIRFAPYADAERNGYFSPDKTASAR